MKKLFSVLTAVFVCAWCVGLGYAQETIVLTNGEWPPYFSEEFKYGGVGSLVCQEAFALGGVDAQYEYMPWKRGFELARDGQYAGTVGWRKTAEREKDFYFSDPILIVKSVFFYRKGTLFDWEILDDVGSMSVGATHGYEYIKLMKPVIERKGGTLEVASSDVANLRKLAIGRIDVFPCSEAVGYYLLKTKLPPGRSAVVTHHPRPVLAGEL